MSEKSSLRLFAEHVSALMADGYFDGAESALSAFEYQAEERGRRRGVEEQADLLLECEEALVWCSAADAFSPDGIAVKGWQRIVVPVLERIRAVRKILAPRDSAPACDAVVSSDPFREWRCGKPKGHEGPHSGEGPRDSAPAIPSVASQGCPECSKPQPGDLGMGSIEARQLRCPHGKYAPRDSGKEG